MTCVIEKNIGSAHSLVWNSSIPLFQEAAFEIPQSAVWLLLCWQTHDMSCKFKAKNSITFNQRAVPACMKCCSNGNSLHEDQTCVLFPLYHINWCGFGKYLSLIKNVHIMPSLFFTLHLFLKDKSQSSYLWILLNLLKDHFITKNPNLFSHISLVKPRHVDSQAILMHCSYVYLQKVRHQNSYTV